MTPGSFDRGSRPPGRGPQVFRSQRAARGPPSREQIETLARREKVPPRIAKGELEGKMPCRIWKKKNPLEAARLEKAYQVLSQHPALDISDALNVAEHGVDPNEVLARKAKVKEKEKVRDARVAVPAAAIDAIFERWLKDRVPLAVALEDRWALDVLGQLQPTSLRLEAQGELRKLHLVAIGARQGWKKVQVALDAELSAQPAKVIAAPELRPVSDPRPFAAVKGAVEVVVRTGEVITATLLAAGPFDIALGQEGAEIVIPLHAIARWTAR